MNNYIFNLETEKIELHFEKAAYDALSGEQKNQLKRNYLWSSRSKSWVSRSKEPNLYHARKAAEELGFVGEERVGERLSFAEKLEMQKERAEERAERYEERADKAVARGKQLQSGIEQYRGDTSFFTQPIIEGHRGSQAFARYRERLYAQYHRGFEEYSKSEYYHERAAIASETAAMSKLNDKGYLMRRIKECRKEIKDREARIVVLEDSLYRVENGEALKRYDGSIMTRESLEKSIQNELELVNKAMDKQAYMEDSLARIGGVTFSRENVKAGDFVKGKRFFGTVTSVGRENIKYRTTHGFILTAAFAEIVSIVPKDGTP